MGSDSFGLFSEAITMMERSMDIRSKKHETIISNIANADTPNFKPFAIEVTEAMKNSYGNGNVRLRRTDEAHLGKTGFAADGVRPKQVDKSMQLTLRGDGNTVDMDHEMMSLAKNSLIYKASAQIISLKLKGLKNVISGGKN